MILKNPEKYCIVFISGDVINDEDVAVCDEKINVKLNSNKIFFRCERKINDSPAFSRIPAHSVSRSTIRIIVEAGYFDSMDENDFLNQLTFKTSVIKYSDEKFSRVYS